MGGRRGGVGGGWGKARGIGLLLSCAWPLSLSRLCSSVRSFRPVSPVLGLFLRIVPDELVTDLPFFSSESLRPRCSAEAGYLEWVDIDTLHFVGNFPESAELYGINSTSVRRLLSFLRFLLN